MPPSIEYESPLPRKKTNDEVLKFSRTINKNHVSIPPTVTKSYMMKNPFYFDIKSKCKDERAKIKQPSHSFYFSLGFH